MGGYTDDVFGASNAEKKTKREQDKINEINTKTSMQGLRQDQQLYERNRRERMRKLMASQRARFASQGISSSGGSAGVVTRRMKNEALRDIKDQRAATQRKLNSVKGKLQNNRRINLLEQSSARKRRDNESFTGMMKQVPLIGGYF